MKFSIDEVQARVEVMGNNRSKILETWERQNSRALEKKCTKFKF